MFLNCAFVCDMWLLLWGSKMATFDNDTFHFDDFQFQTVGFSLLQLELQRVQIDPMAIVGRIPLEIESTIKIPLWLMNGCNSISFVYIYNMRPCKENCVNRFQGNILPKCHSHRWLGKYVNFPLFPVILFSIHPPQKKGVLVSTCVPSPVEAVPWTVVGQQQRSRAMKRWVALGRKGPEPKRPGSWRLCSDSQFQWCCVRFLTFGFRCFCFFTYLDRQVVVLD